MWDDLGVAKLNTAILRIPKIELYADVLGRMFTLISNRAVDLGGISGHQIVRPQTVDNQIR